MTALNSGISWTSGTLNLVVGCTHVSAACDNCYAEAWVNRGLHGNRDFGTLLYYPERLKDLHKFKPAREADGLLAPKCVFINSMSDFWHESIPEEFIHRAFDVFEQHPNIILQILTKRPGRMRRVMSDRYRNHPVPEHFWIGVTCEDNRVARGLDILRDTKARIGDFTAFTSVEPITAPCDKISFQDIDWVLTGGESGPHARPMEFAWLEDVHERVFEIGIPLHFKQYGHPRNNPYVRQYMGQTGCTAGNALRQAISMGHERAAHEKGGATYKGGVYHEKPPHYHKLKAQLNNGVLHAR